jgi:hypothetical protein
MRTNERFLSLLLAIYPKDGLPQSPFYHHLAGELGWQMHKQRRIEDRAGDEHP